MKNLSIQKLLDKALLPLAILISARYIGLFLSSFVLPNWYSFSLNQDWNLLPFLKLPKEFTISANSFSWAFVALVLALYFGFLAFRNTHLNQDFIHPKEASFFHNKNLEFLIVEAEEAVHQNAALLILSAANLFFITKDFFGGTLSPLIFGILLAEVSILILFFSQYFFLSIQLERNQVEEK